MRHDTGPCLCGDPACPNCFHGGVWDDEDRRKEDDAWNAWIDAAPTETERRHRLRMAEENA